jgi:hypothetical protein
MDPKSLLTLVSLLQASCATSWYDDTFYVLGRLDQRQVHTVDCAEEGSGILIQCPQGWINCPAIDNLNAMLLFYMQWYHIDVA